MCTYCGQFQCVCKSPGQLYHQPVLTGYNGQLNSPSYNIPAMPTSVPQEPTKSLVDLKELVNLIRIGVHIETILAKIEKLEEKVEKLTVSQKV